MAARLKCRPSDIVGIDNDWEAFCFDEACMYMYDELTKENPPTPSFLEDLEDKKEESNKEAIDWMMEHSKIIK